MTELRKLVTLATISAIVPMDADAIIGYKVRGWIVVDSKDKYAVGDTVIYIEPDAALPTSVPEFEFLASRSQKRVLNPKNEEVNVHVLRTVKLRGQISQGLILPLSFGLTADSTQEEINAKFDELGVFKYEPPLPIGGAQAIAAFPGFIRKTDSERVQNISDGFLQSLNPSEWVATEKIDGTSSTFWKRDGVLHAAGRNWELSLDGSHAHAQIAKKYELFERIPNNAMIQAEIFGEGIQGNPLRIKGLRLAVFSHALLEPTEVTSEILEFEAWVKENSAPMLDFEFPTTVELALTQVNGMKSTFNSQALSEGVVWWNINGKVYSELGDRPNFKAINNRFLEKQKN